MKQIILSIFFSSLLFSLNVDSKVRNLIGEDNYLTYNKLLKKIFTEDESNIENIIYKLRNNGLLDIFFKSPKIIQTQFIFKNGNPVFNTKVLYDSLTSIGYYYYYPISIEKFKKYSINIEFQSEHFIEPMSIIKEMKDRGCYINDLTRNGEKFIYNFDCENIFIKEANTLEEESKKYVYAKGVYWIKPNNFNKIRIYTNKLDFWHPYIVFYDKSLNIIKIRENEDLRRVLISKIPEDCEYIKIMDSFNKENIKRGIIVKGYK
jgi:hypothetical protein